MDTISPQSTPSADTERTEQKRRKRWTPERTDALFTRVNALGREELASLFCMTFGYLQSTLEWHGAARAAAFFEAVERSASTCERQQAARKAAA